MTLLLQISVHHYAHHLDLNLYSAVFWRKYGSWSTFSGHALVYGHCQDRFVRS